MPSTARWTSVPAVAIVCIFVMGAWSRAPGQEPTGPSLDSLYGKLPLSFEANVGQAGQVARFVARAKGYRVAITSTDVYLDVRDAAPLERVRDRRLARAWTRGDKTEIQGEVVRMRLAGANAAATMRGAELLPGKVNYFIGKDPAAWRTNISTYRKVEVAGVYPGVDLVYWGNQRELEYDFVVHPGASPNVIRWTFDGMEEMQVEANGDLVVRTQMGEFRQHRPAIYQMIDGEARAVEGTHVLLSQREVGFQVRGYKPDRPLIIDPQITYSTMLGGGGGDMVVGMAVDSSGNTYITGGTESVSNFPTTPGAYNAQFSGLLDGFVSKLNPTGTQLVYSTYLGGEYLEIAQGLTVDSSGNVFVGGFTFSFYFPVTPGAFQQVTGDVLHFDGFLTKLDASGSRLLYSTFIGGLEEDEVLSVAVDTAGNAYVVGDTLSSATFPRMPGSFQVSPGGGWDGYVLKLNPAGTALIYGTLLGGAGNDTAMDVEVDGSGDAYVTGSTTSPNFPVTTGSYRTTIGGGEEAFVTKLNSAGTLLGFSTFLGGSGDDQGTALALDSQGAVYVTGTTESANFPTTASAMRTTQAGGIDAFAAKLNPSGGSLAYSTLLGGSRDDLARGIAVDGAGNAYVTGTTKSPDFPKSSDALQSALAGTSDAFLAKLIPAGSALVYGSYLGGANEEDGAAISLGQGGGVYVAGSTSSSNFPTTSGAFQTTKAAGFDAFITKFDFGAQPNAVTLTIVSGNNQSATVGQALPNPLVVEVRDNSGPLAGVTVTFTGSGAMVNPSTAVTDTNGRASTQATLGQTAGAVTITAAAPNALAVTFNATALAAPTPVTPVSAASYGSGALAPGMIVALFGQGFTTQVEQATTIPLPNTLAGVSVVIHDSSGADLPVPLFYARGDQINAYIPPETQGGAATIRVTGENSVVQTCDVTIESVFPGLFSQNGSGEGVAAGAAIRVAQDGSQTNLPIAQYDSGQGRWVGQPIDLGSATDQTILVLYGTGFRNRTGLENVTARIGGVDVQPDYAGAQGYFVGLDQLNVAIPRSLAATGGDVTINLTVDGKTANAITVNIAQSFPAPSITSISPTSGQAGETITTFTVTGSNLGRVTAIEFTPADGITVSNLNATPTAVTAQVVIAEGAAQGIRTVAVVSPEGRSETRNFMVSSIVDPAFVISNLRAGPSTHGTSGDILPITVDYVDVQGGVLAGDVRVNFNIGGGAITGFMTRTPTVTPSSANTGTLSVNLDFAVTFQDGQDWSISISIEAPPGTRRSNTLTGTFHTGATGTIDMTGNWQFTSNSNLYPIATTATGRVTQTGTNLSGTLTLSGTPCATTGTFTGTLTGNAVTINLNENGQIVTFTGTVAADGNSASGTYSAPQGGCTQGDQGTWTGTRTSL